MKTDALTKSKQMLEMLYFEEENKKHKIIEFLNTTANIEADYIMPFKSELIQNVLNKEGKGGVEIVVKHYISELNGANVIFNSSECKEVLASHNYIGINSTEYQSPYPVLELDIPEFDKYVIFSYYIFNCHFYDLQDTCTTYNISFFELCQAVHFPWDMISTNISIEFLETERLRQKPHADNSLNIEDPFSENVVSQDSMKEKKINSNNTPEISSFPEYIRCEKKIEVAKLCKELFAVDHSPKNYSIMFCLLTRRELIFVPDRKRTPIFRAWYNFINSTIPPNNNFTAINKYLDSSANGLRFEDENDTDYLQLEKVFNEKLDSVKL
jgi:hypothetical protein